MKKFKERYPMLLVSSLVFICVYAFYSYAHPIVPWTSDHWAALSWYNSGLLPIDAGNSAFLHPSRILPKVSQTIFGIISAYIVYPVLGDYLQSMVVFLGFIMAVSVTALYVFTYRLLCVFSKDKMLAMCLPILMIVLYFVMFKSKPENNPYMLWCTTQTMAFWFVLPNILNSILVLWLLRKRMNHENLAFNNMNYFTAGMIFCVVYLAMFSNLFECAIFFCYAMYELLFHVIRVIRSEKKGGANSNRYLTGYWINIVAGLLFITHCIVDFTAERAAQIEVNLPFGEALLQSVKKFMELFASIDIRVIVFTIISMLAYLYCCFFSKEQSSEVSKNLKHLNYAILISVVSAISLMLFYIAVTMKADPWYASRIDCMYGFYFFAVLALILICLYVMNSIPKAVFILPFIMLLFGVQMTRASMPLSDRYDFENTTARQRYTIVHEWIQQIQIADKNGQSKVILLTPYLSGLGVDSPYYSMSDTLRNHGIIDEPMEIIIELVDEFR